MRFKVYLMRRRGRRLPWRQVVNGPFYIGELLTHEIQVGGHRYRAATLRPLDPVAPAPIAELYEPVLLGFTVLAFQLRGFERVDGPSGGFSVVQEWHCEAP